MAPASAVLATVKAATGLVCDISNMIGTVMKLYRNRTDLQPNLIELAITLAQMENLMELLGECEVAEDTINAIRRDVLSGTELLAKISKASGLAHEIKTLGHYRGKIKSFNDVLARRLVVTHSLLVSSGQIKSEAQVRELVAQLKSGLTDFMSGLTDIKSDTRDIKSDTRDIKSDTGDIKSTLTQVKSFLTGSFKSEITTELKAEMTEVKAEFKADMDASFALLIAKLEEMRAEIAEMKAEMKEFNEWKGSQSVPAAAIEEESAPADADASEAPQMSSDDDDTPAAVV